MLSRRSFKFSRSTVRVIILNLFFAGFGVWQGWDGALFIWMYWLQVSLLSFFSIIRTLTLRNFTTTGIAAGLNKTAKPTRKLQILTGSFYFVVFSILLATVAIFINSFFPLSTLSSDLLFINGGLFLIFLAVRYLFDLPLLLGGGVHLEHYLKAPYYQIIPLVVVVFLGFLFLLYSLTAVIGLFVAKIASELYFNKKFPF